MGYMQYSPKSGDEAMDMLTRSRAAGGVAVAGGFFPRGVPRDRQMTNARELRAFMVEAPGIEAEHRA